MTTHTIPDHPVLCMGENFSRPKIRHVLKDIKSEDDKKFIALTDDRVAAAGFIHADVLNALATSSSRQMPDKVVKKLEFLTCSVEER